MVRVRADISPSSRVFGYVGGPAYSMQCECMRRGSSRERLVYAADLSRHAFQKLQRAHPLPGMPVNPGPRDVMAVAQVLDVPSAGSCPPTGMACTHDRRGTPNACMPGKTAFRPCGKAGKRRRTSAM